MHRQTSYATPAAGPLTVVQTAERLGLSRRRFYELIDDGKFPPPVYRLDNRKPLYPPELQAVCLRIRNTGEAFDGTLILFNRARSKSAPQRAPAARASNRATPSGAMSEQEHADLIGYLADHGLVVTSDQVTAALAACFPGGSDGVEPGHVWREVFRHLRRENRT